MGYPPDAKVGSDGLEHIFQARLAGQVGGKLLAGKRVLASVKPVKARAVHTTINPGMETAAVQSLAGQYAGIAVMNPRTGGLEALAGIAFSALQPPGSTMKIVTTVAALQAHLVTLDTVFPDATEATVGGYTLQNAGGEDCGGTLLNAFAVSCNSVFAPLGLKVGAKRFLQTAERFGFNHPSSIPGALEPSVPPKSLDTGAELGPSAIGQGLVQATPLTMTDVAATIADGGRRPIPTLDADAKPRFVRVTTPRVASEVQQTMEAVVSEGTGTAAAIPGVVVAGKTGTSQIENGSSSDTQGSLAEHRRLVRRLRAGPVAAGRRRGAVPQRRRGRGRGGAGGARRARVRPQQQVASDAQPAAYAAATTLGLSVPWSHVASATRLGP